LTENFHSCGVVGYHVSLTAANHLNLIWIERLRTFTKFLQKIININMHDVLNFNNSYKTPHDITL